MGKGGHFSGTKGGRNSIPSENSVSKHIFRNKKGHLSDTVENRKLLENTANNNKNYLGKDRYGNEWYQQTLKNGKQLWTEVRNGKIINGGLNDIPKEWNPLTGLKKA